MSWHQNAYYARRRAQEAVDKAAYTERQAALLDAGGQLMELDRLEADLQKRLERAHNAGKHPGFDYEGCRLCSRQRAPEPKLRPKEGDIGQALYYMGDCPAGDGRVNFGDGYQIVGGKPWHYSCAVAGTPVTCSLCGREFPPLGINRFPICNGLCWGAWQAWLWGVQRLITNLSPEKSWRYFK